MTKLLQASLDSAFAVHKDLREVRRVENDKWVSSQSRVHLC
jgi:hypothetical protein